MPIHDWTRVDAGMFHNFHRGWSVEVKRVMNRGLPPDGFSALLERTGHPTPAADESEAGSYARRTDRIRVCRGLGPSLDVIEIVSPGHTDSGHAVRQFVATAVDFLRGGVNYLLVDLLPPTPHAPDGLFRLIWDELGRPPLNRPVRGGPFTVAPFAAADGPTVYLDFAGEGEDLPDAPLFLSRGEGVSVPLERTYEASWGETPHETRDLVAPPESP